MIEKIMSMDTAEMALNGGYFGNRVDICMMAQSRVNGTRSDYFPQKKRKQKMEIQFHEHFQFCILCGTISQKRRQIFSNSKAALLSTAKHRRKFKCILDDKKIAA